MKLSLGVICSAIIGVSLLGTTGCVDLSGTRLNPEKKVSSSYQSIQLQQQTQGEVHTMLGGLGMFSVGMEGMRAAIARQNPQVSTYSNMWYNAGDVTKAISSYYHQHPKHRPIILMGHSLGANEQIKVARNLNELGIPVELLVTVDAVSQTIVPANVKQVLNIYKPGYVPMLSGLKLKAVNPKTTFIENINVKDIDGVQVNHFTIDKNKAIQTLILARVKKVLIDGNRRKT